MFNDSDIVQHAMKFTFQSKYSLMYGQQKPEINMKPKTTSLIALFKPLSKHITLVSAATRIGSLDILNSPSRFGHVLFYPDGRIVKDASK